MGLSRPVSVQNGVRVCEKNGLLALDLDGPTGWDAYVSAYVADESSPPNERSKKQNEVLRKKGVGLLAFFFLSVLMISATF